ncbi:MAG TPA: TIM44-like domain-containing protein [Devosia sp.]|nr:TIM44-like domain-containing protein [Devosia sp.]
MLGSRWFRLSALFAVLLTAFSLTFVSTAEARFGGSFGSRGMRTYQTIPATPTVPTTTGPIQRSMNGGSTYAPGYGYGYGYNRPFGGGLFNGLGGWLLGGLLFSGLFGMIFHGGWMGFGGFGGIFSLIIQLAILYFVLRWLFRRFGWRQAAAGPGYGGSYDFARQDYPPGGPGYGAGAAYGPGSGPSAGGRDEIGVTNADLNMFEARLKQLQDAYSREDYDALRRITTPEVMSYLTEELAQSAAKGLRNEVFDVRLLSGDVAEAWREGSDEYATAAMRYESRDVMRNRATGELVSGEDRIVERREVWTFVRHNRGEWLISAIQGA